MCTFKKIKTSAKYLGHFMCEEVKMPFTKVEGMKRKDIINLGDILYFMFVDDKLMKIGKAGGKEGFAGRLSMYQNGCGKNGDKTNRRIMNVMKSLNKSKIEVFYLQSPRKVIEYNCPLTNELLTKEVETAKLNERRLTYMYLSEDSNRELPFCNQLN